MATLMACDFQNSRMSLGQFTIVLCIVDTQKRIYNFNIVL